MNISRRAAGVPRNEQGEFWGFAAAGVPRNEQGEFWGFTAAGVPRNEQGEFWGFAAERGTLPSPFCKIHFAKRKYPPKHKGRRTVQILRPFSFSRIKKTLF